MHLAQTANEHHSAVVVQEVLQGDDSPEAEHKWLAILGDKWPTGRILKLIPPKTLKVAQVLNMHILQLFDIWSKLEKEDDKAR